MQVVILDEPAYHLLTPFQKSLERRTGCKLHAVGYRVLANVTHIAHPALRGDH